jgi:YD repeat-containing protein
MYGVSRGKVFVTADGTSATFISDTEIKDKFTVTENPFATTGTLFMRDGTRYRIQGGVVTRITDPNGNSIDFSYGDQWGRLSTITDSLNRQVSIDYDVQDGSYGLCDRIRFNGFNGTERIIRVSKAASLLSVLRSDLSQDLKTFYELFPNLNGSSSQSDFDLPFVTSKVWLPDGVRKYEFYYNHYGELAKIVLPTVGA